MHPRVFLLFVSVASAFVVNDTLIWGPYRPNLYFGLRPRLPQSLMTGLMWFGTHDYASLQRWYLSFPFVDTNFDAHNGQIHVMPVNRTTNLIHTLGLSMTHSEEECK